MYRLLSSSIYSYSHKVWTRGRGYTAAASPVPNKASGGFRSGAEPAPPPPPHSWATD